MNASIKEEQEQGYVPSRYSKAFNNYSKTEIKSVIPILKSIARGCHIGFKYPIYKLLKAIAKIFLLNEIEGIFLVHMIRETNWDIKDKLIVYNSQLVRDVVCYSSDQPEYKSLILYLMLVTYSLKFYLNENNEQLLEEAERICPNFKTIFQNWAKKNSHLTKRINPKTLNKVYQELYNKIRHEEPDFSMLVDSIIQISPAYNPEKSDKDRRLEKNMDKKEVKEEYLHRQPIKMVKLEGGVMSSGLNDNPMFSSSRIYEMTGAGISIDVSNSFQVFGQQQKSSFLGAGRFGGSAFCSSVLGMPNMEVKDEQQDCQQLNIGLQNGESQENIILRDNVPQPSHTSVINLSRGFSYTDKYIRNDSQDKYE